MLACAVARLERRQGYNGAPTAACRRRRPGTDGPAPSGSSAAASLKQTPAAAATSPLLLLLPRCMRTKLLLPTGVLGSGTAWAAATSAARAGSGGGAEHKLGQNSPLLVCAPASSQLQGTASWGAMWRIKHKLGGCQGLTLTDLPMWGWAWASLSLPTATRCCELAGEQLRGKQRAAQVSRGRE